MRFISIKNYLIRLKKSVEMADDAIKARNIKRVLYKDTIIKKIRECCYLNCYNYFK